MNPKNFFGELKRRNVYKVAIAYGVVAWLLMQIATQSVDTHAFQVTRMRFWVISFVPGSGRHPPFDAG